MDQDAGFYNLMNGDDMDDDESGEKSYEPHPDDDRSSAHMLPSEAFISDEKIMIRK